MHDFLFTVTEYVILAIELIAVLLAVVTILACFYELIFEDRFNLQKFNERDRLSVGMVTCLELLMAAEILKTVVIASGRDALLDLLILGILVFLRTFMVKHLKEDIENKK